MKTHVSLFLTDNVHEMFSTLYPTTTEAQENKWSRHIRESLDVISENECAAHATLFYAAPIDFYVYIEPKCYLGDLAYSITGQSATSLNTVQIRSTNALIHVNTVYDVSFNLPDFAWNRYMIEVIELDAGGGLTECGVKCELYKNTCDYFAHAGTKCYIGVYSQTEGTAVTVAETVKTYHKSCKFFILLFEVLSGFFQFHKFFV